MDIADPATLLLDYRNENYPDYDRELFTGPIRNHNRMIGR